MNLSVAMCEAMVDGWVAGWNMTRVVAHAWVLTGDTPEDNVQRYTKAAEAIKVKRIDGYASAKTWIPRHMPQLNDALWAGRKRESCIICAQRSLGICKKSRGLQFVSARSSDKRHDWNTVK